MKNKLQKNIELEKLICPITYQSLSLVDDELVTHDGKNSYKISREGIPLFENEYSLDDAQRQKLHYNKVAQSYSKNLKYPHTQVYSNYLDSELFRNVSFNDLSNVLEVCCGHGNLLDICPYNIEKYCGIDISQEMLKIGVNKNSNKNIMFIQGDATRMPFKSDAFSSVFMLGGIHHVPNRASLFKELYRVLKPGGMLYFREPVNDFALWRWIRSVIYRLSPALDSDTESPLQWTDTVPVLQHTGFRVKKWDTVGFFGFCLFMNSDVLVFNRFFRFIPFIKSITRLFVYIDTLVARIPSAKGKGLQVIGIAEKTIA